MERGGIIRKQAETPPNGRNKGGVGQIQLPPAFADTQRMCGRELEDGKTEILGRQAKYKDGAAPFASNIRSA